MIVPAGAPRWLLGFFGAALVISGGITWLYAERAMNRCAFLATVLGFSLSLCTVALVPYDVWAAQVRINSGRSAAQSHSAVLPISPEFVYACWEAMYWLTVFLCYILVPLLMEFETAGDFRFRARLKTSLRRNCAWYVVYFILLVLLLIFIPNTWMSADGHEQGKLSSLKGFCISASNTFGLLVLTLLMGFGLVGLPRNLWLASDTTGKLRNLHARVTSQNVARLAAHSELTEVIAEVAKECQAVKDRMTDSDETFADKAPLQSAVNILQATLEKSEEFHQKLVETTSFCSGQALDPRSSTASTLSSNPNFQSFTSQTLEARSLAPSNTVSARRQEIRERRQDLESYRLSGLLSQEKEGSGPKSPPPEAVRLSPTMLDPGPNGTPRGPRRGSADLLDDMRHLTTLHSALKFVTLEARRASHQWEQLVQRCALIEDLDNLQAESSTDMPGSQWSIRRQLYEASWSYSRSSPLCCSCSQRLFRERYRVREGWRRAVMFWFRILRPRAFKFCQLCCGYSECLHRAWTAHDVL